MEHLLRRHQPLRQPLRMVVTQERLQHLAVGVQPVGPEVVPHQLAGGADLLVQERQRALAGGGVLQLLHALRLRLLQRLEHRRGKPWVLFNKRAADAGDVHDREDAGALEVVLAGRDRVGKQPADVRIVLARHPRHPRRDERIDLAALEQLRDGLAFRRVHHLDVRRQLDRDLLRPRRIVDAAPHPLDVRRLHAVVVLQDRARPDAGGELEFRQADALALEVLRLLDPVGAHIDAVVPEHPRHERRDTDIGTIALRGLDRVARHRQFADVEIHGAERAEENLLRRQHHENGVDSVDLHGAVKQRARPVVVADGHR